MKTCFTLENRCEHCLVCAPLLAKLKHVKLTEILGQGAAGVVLKAIWKRKHVAVKFVILNSVPFTFGMRVPITCDPDTNVVSRFFQKWLLHIRWALRSSDFISRPISTRDFEAEAAMATRMSDLEIGPRVYVAEHCSRGLTTWFGETLDVGVIVMDKLDARLDSWINDWMDKVRKRTFTAFIKRHWTRVVANTCNLAKRAEPYLPGQDLHTGNIMLRVPSLEVKFIDFGYAKFEGSLRAKVWMVLHDIQVLLKSNARVLTFNDAQIEHMFMASDNMLSEL